MQFTDENIEVNHGSELKVTGREEVVEEPAIRSWGNCRAY